MRGRAIAGTTADKAPYQAGVNESEMHFYETTTTRPPEVPPDRSVPYNQHLRQRQIRRHTTERGFPPQAGP